MENSVVFLIDTVVPGTVKDTPSDIAAFKASIVASITNILLHFSSGDTRNSDNEGGMLTWSWRFFRSTQVCHVGQTYDRHFHMINGATFTELESAIEKENFLVINSKRARPTAPAIKGIESALWQVLDYPWHKSNGTKKATGTSPYSLERKTSKLSTLSTDARCLYDTVDICNNVVVFASYPVSLSELEVFVRGYTTNTCSHVYTQPSSFVVPSASTEEVPDVNCALAEEGIRDVDSAVLEFCLNTLRDTFSVTRAPMSRFHSDGIRLYMVDMSCRARYPTPTYSCTDLHSNLSSQTHTRAQAPSITTTIRNTEYGNMMLCSCGHSRMHLYEYEGARAMDEILRSLEGWVLSIHETCCLSRKVGLKKAIQSFTHGYSHVPSESQSTCWRIRSVKCELLLRGANVDTNIISTRMVGLPDEFCNVATKPRLTVVSTASYAAVMELLAESGDLPFPLNNPVHSSVVMTIDKDEGASNNGVNGVLGCISTTNDSDAPTEADTSTMNLFNTLASVLVEQSMAIVCTMSVTFTNNEESANISSEKNVKNEGMVVNVGVVAWSRHHAHKQSQSQSQSDPRNMCIRFLRMGAVSEYLAKQTRVVKSGAPVFNDTVPIWDLLGYMQEHKHHKHASLKPEDIMPVRLLSLGVLTEPWYKNIQAPERNTDIQTTLSTRSYSHENKSVHMNIEVDANAVASAEKEERTLNMDANTNVNVQAYEYIRVLRQLVWEAHRKHSTPKIKNPTHTLHGKDSSTFTHFGQGTDINTQPSASLFSDRKLSLSLVEAVDLENAFSEFDMTISMLRDGHSIRKLVSQSVKSAVEVYMSQLAATLTPSEVKKKIKSIVRKRYIQSHESVSRRVFEGSAALTGNSKENDAQATAFRSKELRECQIQVAIRLQLSLLETPVKDDAGSKRTKEILKFIGTLSFLTGGGEPFVEYIVEDVSKTFGHSLARTIIHLKSELDLEDVGVGVIVSIGAHGNSVTTLSSNSLVRSASGRGRVSMGAGAGMSAGSDLGPLRSEESAQSQAMAVMCIENGNITGQLSSSGSFGTLVAGVGADVPPEPNSKVAMRRTIMRVNSSRRTVVVRKPDAMTKIDGQQSLVATLRPNNVNDRVRRRPSQVSRRDGPTVDHYKLPVQRRRSWFPPATLTDDDIMSSASVDTLVLGDYSEEDALLEGVRASPEAYKSSRLSRSLFSTHDDMCATPLNIKAGASFESPNEISGTSSNNVNSGLTYDSPFPSHMNTPINGNMRNANCAIIAPPFLKVGQDASGGDTIRVAGVAETPKANFPSTAERMKSWASYREMNGVEEAATPPLHHTVPETPVIGHSTRSSRNVRDNDVHTTAGRYLGSSLNEKSTSDDMGDDGDSGVNSQGSTSTCAIALFTDHNSNDNRNASTIKRPYSLVDTTGVSIGEDEKNHFSSRTTNSSNKRKMTGIGVGLGVKTFTSSRLRNQVRSLGETILFRNLILEETTGNVNDDSDSDMDESESTVEVGGVCGAGTIVPRLFKSSSKFNMLRKSHSQGTTDLPDSTSTVLGKKHGIDKLLRISSTTSGDNKRPMPRRSARKL
eukprot:CFRG3441T1